MHLSRREFFKTAGAGAAALAGTAALPGKALAAPRDFDISLAAYSLHRTIGPGRTPMLELPRLAREEFGIRAIELVNWMLESDDPKYIAKFVQSANEQGVKILLIMVDREGAVGAPSEYARRRAVDGHKRWLDIAKTMGCRSIRMNWAGARSDTMADPEELGDFIRRSVSPLLAICSYADLLNLNVLIENHGGPSSHPDALVRLMNEVGHHRLGTLPDFGNFPPRVNSNGGPGTVDPYDAVDKMMPYAKAVSAKCYEFHPDTGEETSLFYDRLIEIVVDKHGYNGHIGIEYEGLRMSEFDGIKACKALLERLRENAPSEG